MGLEELLRSRVIRKMRPDHDLALKAIGRSMRDIGTMADDADVEPSTINCANVHSYWQSLNLSLFIFHLGCGM